MDLEGVLNMTVLNIHIISPKWSVSGITWCVCTIGHFSMDKTLYQDDTDVELLYYGKLKFGKIPGKPKRIRLMHLKRPSKPEDKSAIIVEISLRHAKQLANTKVLDLSDGNHCIRDVAFLGACKKLVELDMSFNALRAFNSLTFVSVLGGLKHMSLQQNKLVDVTMNGLNNLRSLNLKHNRIKDISKLVELPKLVYLDLSENKIENGLSVLRKLKNLKFLDLSKNRIDMNPDMLKAELFVPLSVCF